jgi:3'(2'), 5'-bisphosphate nucleotidase
VSVFDPAVYAEHMDALTAIAMAAAEAIRRSKRAGHVKVKSDGTPVTVADEAAEAVIRRGLTRVAPGLPIISEEAAQREKPSVNAGSYFLVDPLDGTKEFIAGRDEYTVNIALIAEGAPVVGIIAAPSRSLIWRGVVGRGAERLEFSGRNASEPQAIKTRTRPEGELIVMVSRSHLDARTQTYLDDLPHTKLLRCGSSVKFCRVAEGVADLYPRLSPTHDWDIAAGHAILTAAGGNVIDPDGAALTYGSPDLIIPAFLAWSGPTPTEGALTSGY